MKEIISIITLPVLAGLLLFFVPEKLRTIKGLVALAFKYHYMLSDNCDL